MATLEWVRRIVGGAKGWFDGLAVEGKDPMSDRQWMELAVEEAKKSKSEGTKAHPFVGAVVVDQSGKFIASAHRGELALGDHAEYTLLEKKLGTQSLAGATLFSTLEPCTSRNHPKVPCVERAIERRVGRVVIGTLDPNQDIRGKGEWRLLQNNIHVAKFDPDLVAVLLDLNRHFIREQAGLGVTITGPDRSPTVNVAEFEVQGTYRNKPAARELWAFVRKDNVYWPQNRMRINDDNTWSCWVTTDPAGEYDVIVARVNEDISLLIDFYYEVAEEFGRTGARKYMGRKIPRLPKGIQVLDSIRVTRV